MEEIIRHVYKDTYRALQVMEKYNAYTIHPFGRGSLTTDGVQYSGVTTGSTGTTDWKTVDSAATIRPIAPTDDTDDMDELELGLTAEFKNSSVTTGKTTLGYVWQIKDDTETTWTNLHTTKSVASTHTTWTARTLSGRITPAAGYNKLPFNIRLRMMNKKASHGLARIKNSSYVKVMSKVS